MRRLMLGMTAVCVFSALGTVALAATDVVLYSSDVTTVRGNWAKTSDSTAAGGQLVSSSDLGWSTTDAPLASPNDYFEASFNAVAGTPYHVWLRLRASGNSKWNDSVWVQFGDSTDTGGTAVYRIGTTTGLLVNLEPCSNCGVSGWGWQDRGWWMGQSPIVQFSTGGSHTIRVQTREDGVQVDQIVLSPSTYFSSAPGQGSNDTTIVARPGGSGSTPYTGTPAAIPGTIQAEDFDNGGEGVAYHDSSPGNAGGAYRSTDVDVEGASGGGYDVGWVAAGEWLQYTVNVATAGTYLVQFRIAAPSAGGSFHLEMNGANVTGSIGVPATGGWQSWQITTRSVTLGAGQQIARLVMDSAGPNGVANFDWMQFSTSGAASTPYTGSPAPIPGTIEVENFDNGGEGVAYHDTSPGNTGGAYRSTDVDIEPASGGGYDVGWVAAGEWLQYSVTVASAGSYTVEFRVACPGTCGTFHLEMNGSNVTGALTVPNTGGWQSWQTFTAPVSLSAGAQMARLVFDTAGPSGVGNFDSMQLSTGSGGGGGTSGATISVPAGGDLQAAINKAQPGDTIVLARGATFSGSFSLPPKSGSTFITIRSAAPDSSLPPDGVRISPAYAPQLARVQGGVAGMAAFITAPSSHHWKLEFLEIVSTYVDGNIMELGDGSSAQNSLGVVPHDLVVDRCYIHGDPSNGQRRGIALNSASTIVMNSYISDIKEVNSDTQAIGGWNGPGPYTITNNYLEAAGENVMFGGDDPWIDNLIPSDITFRQNLVSKPLAWMSQSWTIKNLIELKNAQRIVIDGNIFENNWAAGQQGYSIMLTPRNQEGRAPWSNVQHLQFTNNVVRHVAAGFDILGTDYLQPSGQLNDITVRNNLFLDVSKAEYGGNGLMVLTLGGSNITFDHNTVFTDGTSVLYGDSTTVSGFVFTNNIAPDNLWAIMGTGASPGNGTIAMYYPGSTFRDNIFIGSNPAQYPSGNYYPATIGGVGFVDPSANFRLTSASPYRTGATDGSAVGCNIDALNAAAGTSY